MNLNKQIRSILNKQWEIVTTGMPDDEKEYPYVMMEVEDDRIILQIFPSQNGMSKVPLRSYLEKVEGLTREQSNELMELIALSLL